MVSGQQIVQVFHNQQAIAFDTPREHYYQFNFQDKLIGIDTSTTAEQSISLFVDEQFATQLA
ncbi:metalloprotease, partial [Pseudoalteromonas ruthenica]